MEPATYNNKPMTLYEIQCYQKTNTAKKFYNLSKIKCYYHAVIVKYVWPPDRVWYKLIQSAKNFQNFIRNKDGSWFFSLVNGWCYSRRLTMYIEEYNVTITNFINMYYPSRLTLVLLTSIGITKRKSSFLNSNSPVFVLLTTTVQVVSSKQYNYIQPTE